MRDRLWRCQTVKLTTEVAKTSHVLFGEQLRMLQAGPEGFYVRVLQSSLESIEHKSIRAVTDSVDVLADTSQRLSRKDAGLPTTCQPSFRKRGMIVLSNSGSIRITPRVVGLSVYGSYNCPQR